MRGFKPGCDITASVRLKPFDRGSMVTPERRRFAELVFDDPGSGFQLELLETGFEHLPGRTNTPQNKMGVPVTIAAIPFLVVNNQRSGTIDGIEMTSDDFRCPKLFVVLHGAERAEMDMKCRGIG